MFKVGNRYLKLIILSFIYFLHNFERPLKFKAGDKVKTKSGDIFIIEGLSTRRNHKVLGEKDIFYCGHRVANPRQRDCSLPELELELDTIKL